MEKNICAQLEWLINILYLLWKNILSQLEKTHTSISGEYKEECIHKRDIISLVISCMLTNLIEGKYRL